MSCVYCLPSHIGFSATRASASTSDGSSKGSRRPAKQRKQDTLNRLEHDEDAWVATADGDGSGPYLVPDEEADLFAAKTRFDPRRLATPYLYFRVRPRWIQAWREANELDGSELMRDGEWLVAD